MSVDRQLLIVRCRRAFANRFQDAAVGGPPPPEGPPQRPCGGRCTGGFAVVGLRMRIQGASAGPPTGGSLPPRSPEASVSVRSPPLPLRAPVPGGPSLWWSSRTRTCVREGEGGLRLRGLLRLRGQPFFGLWCLPSAIVTIGSGRGILLKDLQRHRSWAVNTYSLTCRGSASGSF